MLADTDPEWQPMGSKSQAAIVVAVIHNELINMNNLAVTPGFTVLTMDKITKVIHSGYDRLDNIVFTSIIESGIVNRV